MPCGRTILEVDPQLLPILQMAAAPTGMLAACGLVRDREPDPPAVRLQHPCPPAAAWGTTFVVALSR